MSRQSMLFIIPLLLALKIGKRESKSCNLEGTSYICTGISRIEDFQRSLPNLVKKVILIGTDKIKGSIPNGLFEDSSWINVSELSLFQFTRILSIDTLFLNGLKYLKYLSISKCYYLQFIHPAVFDSTPDLEGLHLDEDSNLRLSVVENALRDKVDKLKYLSLQALQIEVHEASFIGTSFFNVLEGKQLQYLDLSYANIAGFALNDSFQKDAVYNLRYLNGSHSKLSWYGISRRSIINTFMQKLEVSDFSGCQSVIPYPTSTLVRTTKCDTQELKYCFFENVVMFQREIHVNYEEQLIECNCDRLEVLDISNNQLVHFNVTITGERCFRGLVKLDLSKNDMEYISPLLLSSLPTLKILDMSENQLHKMQHMSDFSNLLSGNSMLEVLFLRNNHLSSVPNSFLSSNTKLQLLDLRENDLTKVSIDFSHILNLKFIELGKNQLGGLPSNTYQTLDVLYAYQATGKESNMSFLNANLLLQSIDKKSIREKYGYGYNPNVSLSLAAKCNTIPQYLTIDLSDNPIECRCDNDGFLKWAVTTKIRFINGESLMCTYGNTKSIIDSELHKRVKYDCELPFVVIKASSATVFVIVSFSIVALLFRNIRVKRRKAEDIAILKREIKNNHRDFNYLAFIPFCSHNYDVVETNALPALRIYLKKKLNTEDDVVCTGMENFIPGMLIAQEINRCIDESLIVVPIITTAFIQSAWSQNECVVAIQKHKKVLILMEEQTDISQAHTTVKNLIENYTRATWSNREGHFIIHPSWDIICDRIIALAAETLRKQIQLQRQAPDNLMPLIEDNFL